ncbi:hypothetical protein E2C01_005630 [Portunus trituberculatus]|uniref:Uncharacterized protein n=1 Tax=Portunus trituberculatus TaxID=210409 RepID=A0A5B7CUV5_PORTR|nr:hypothetical protein [Portunus trituberculatus]
MLEPLAGQNGKRLSAVCGASFLMIYELPPGQASSNSPLLLALVLFLVYSFTTTLQLGGQLRWPVAASRLGQIESLIGDQKL